MDRLCGVDAAVQRGGLPAASYLRCSGLQGMLPLNPQGLAGVTPDLAFNTAVSFVTNTNWQSYGGETTMSYLTQMARADRAELRLGGDRHRAGGCADPRLRPPVGQGHRQLLGRSDALHALHPAADLVRRGALPRLAGHAAELQRLCRCDDPRGREADDRAGPGRLADRHQDARHQRRRLLQRQRRASLRESDGAQQSRADAADLRARRRPHQRLRPHGRRPAPGLGGLRRHGRDVR